MRIKLSWCLSLSVFYWSKLLSSCPIQLISPLHTRDPAHFDSNSSILSWKISPMCKGLSLNTIPWSYVSPSLAALRLSLVSVILRPRLSCKPITHFSGRTGINVVFFPVKNTLKTSKSPRRTSCVYVLGRRRCGMSSYGDWGQDGDVIIRKSFLFSPILFVQFQIHVVINFWWIFTI